MLKELDGKKEIGPEACVEIGENTENSIKDWSARMRKSNIRGKITRNGT